MLGEVEQLRVGLDGDKAKLTRLEAIGQGKTPEAVTLREDISKTEMEITEKYQDLGQKIEGLGKPLRFEPMEQVEVPKQRFTVTSPDKTVLGEFGSQAEAQGAVQRIIGEEPFKQMEQRKVATEFMRTQLIPQLRKFGLHDVGLKLADQLDQGAGGAYTKKLIQIAMNEDRKSTRLNSSHT